MIKLVGLIGKTVYVRASEIISIEAAADNIHSILRVGQSGYQIFVKETCQEVISKMSSTYVKY